MATFEHQESNIVLPKLKLCSACKITSPRVASVEFFKFESRYLPWFTYQKLASTNFFPGQTSIAWTKGQEEN